MDGKQSDIPQVLGKPEGSAAPADLPKARADGKGDDMPVYVNPYTNIAGSGNTCGQAAIATVADYNGLEISGITRTDYNPRDNRRLHWNNDPAVSRINAQFAPDVIGGPFGTSGGQIKNALQAFGIKQTSVIYSGTSVHWEQLWAVLQSYVTKGWICPVLLDATLMPGGNFPFTGHWPVVFRIDAKGVHLTNCGVYPVTMSVDLFLRAWNYMPLVYGYNHCGVLPYNY